MGETPLPAERYGFHRTVCNCAFCRAPCHHLPGSLDVADLELLCPPGRDLFAWAEEHLRALIDKSFPTLVPARGLDGGCHWLHGGKCLVHGNAPYGCSFFDAHQTDDEANRRAAATIRARLKDAATEGFISRFGDTSAQGTGRPSGRPSRPGRRGRPAKASCGTAAPIIVRRTWHSNWRQSLSFPVP